VLAFGFVIRSVLPIYSDTLWRS